MGGLQPAGFSAEGLKSPHSSGGAVWPEEDCPLWAIGSVQFCAQRNFRSTIFVD
jgi:hypothetical protein